MHRRRELPISFHGPIEGAVFDAELLASVQRLIPPERLRGYLLELDRQLQIVMSLAAGDASLADRAHKIVSQAGMLGLTRMSQRAKALEDACRAGIGQAAALSECSAAKGDIELFALPATPWPPSLEANG